MTGRVNTVGITLGDPAGIGPELVARALAQRWEAALRVYGDRGLIQAAAAQIGAVPLWEGVELVEVTAITAPAPGSVEGGKAQLAYLDAAIAEARIGRIAAMCTAPINKSSCLAAGFGFPGHTEMLAARLSEGAPLPVTMMLAGPKLRVALATTHVSLRDVPSAITSPGVERAIVHAAGAMKEIYGIASPRIAVAGLNPHAGEGGHFGDEEGRVIAPAIERARFVVGDATISGPHVPDAVFRDAVEGRYDAVVALYHDQGLIPVKLVDFEEAVNVTLGLPIVRTSPDHGVAYDIAGKGIARPTSFFAALRLACGARARNREKVSDADLNDRGAS